MESYTVQKIDTNLYIKGFSGPLVYSALYGIVGAFFLFVTLYISIGTLAAVLVCIPSFFAYLYRLNGIQKKLGHAGWAKKQVSKKLPQFIIIKQRIRQIQD